MKYILTDLELRTLQDIGKHEREKLQETLQDLCTKVADHMPIDWAWGGKDPKPWGCIMSKNQEWYCDQCPVESVCPCEHKHFSK